MLRRENNFPWWKKWKYIKKKTKKFLSIFDKKRKEVKKAQQSYRWSKWDWKNKKKNWKEKFSKTALSTLEKKKVRRRIVECQEEIYNTAEACRRSNKIGEGKKENFFAFLRTQISIYKTIIKLWRCGNSFLEGFKLIGECGEFTVTC